MAPITKLLWKAKTFEWIEECQQAQDVIQQQYVDAPIFITPKWDLNFHVHIGASNLAVRAMLIQNTTWKCNQLIAYAFHLLNNAERSYTNTEHETLAMVYALHKFQHYLLSNKFVFYVDHMALLIKKPQVFRCIARWFFLFLQYDFLVVYKPSKSHFVTNVLSRLPNSTKNKGIFDQISNATFFTLQPNWLQDVHDYMLTKTFSIHFSQEQKRKLALKAFPFTLKAGVFYRQGHGQVLRCCVQLEEISIIIN